MLIRKVLLVDDDPDIRSIGSLSLRNIGKWQVVVAESGVAAIQAIAQEKPDLVLLDVMMPGLDGPATLVRIQALAAQTVPPVIFMTAKTDPSELQRLVALGAKGAISKPFNPLLLLKQIRQILDHES